MGDMSALLPLFDQMGSGTTAPVNPPTIGANQVIATMTSLFLYNGFLAAYLGNDGATMNRLVDGDIDLYTSYQGMGNGGSNKVYRLREGIERFLITDINNAGSANVAQSGLPITYDHLAYVPSSFNHIPGGSNALFMDGHVEFLKYEPNGESLCNKGVANLLGVMSNVF
jgi:prepilin-type processing-associated H-X9-DG protein